MKRILDPSHPSPNPKSEIRNPQSLSRRQLLKTLGGGILVAITVPGVARTVLGSQGRGQGQRGGESGAGRQGGQTPQAISSWLHIGTDGAITVFTGKVEVGQGSRTSLAQGVAEELRVPIESVKMVMGDTDLVPFDQGTFGSQTTPRMLPQLRKAAASARETLIDLAAEKWKADRTDLRAENGRIVNQKKTGSEAQSATYGELAKGQPLDRPIRADAPLTPPAYWSVLGKAHANVEGRAVVTGAHAYASDVKADGMLFGKVLRPPTLNATLVSADVSAAEAMPGVKVFKEGDFVGVAAPTLRQAKKAIEAVKAEWKETAGPSNKELFELLKSTAEPIPGNAGQTPTPLPPNAFKAQYTVAYIAHAPLEPRAAMAEMSGGKMTVHTGTQRPFGVRTEVARALNFGEERVRILVPDTGSGYGGKHTGEAAVEAARLAKAAGKPVRVVWTREEEFMFAYFRPAGVIDVAAAIDAEGKLTDWSMANFNSGPAALNTPYDVKTVAHQFRASKSPLRQGSYRGLASTANVFARETAMDELAHQAKLDPLEFRLKNLINPTLRAVLLEATKAFGWDKRVPPTGRMDVPVCRGCGIACGTDKGGFVATCAEVEVDPRSKRIKVLRAVTAFDCGAVVNPAGLENQVSGAVVMGLGGALMEEILFENGKIANGRFLEYWVPRFSDVPRLQTILMDRKDAPSAGAGESAIIAIAPAVGNAVFAATGVRLRGLPLRLA